MGGRTRGSQNRRFERVLLGIEGIFVKEIFPAFEQKNFIEYLSLSNGSDTGFG